MPSIGKRCHELRSTDADVIWRNVYRIDPDAIIIGKVFKKKTQETPKSVIATCKARFQQYDKLTQ